MVTIINSHAITMKYFVTHLNILKVDLIITKRILPDVEVAVCISKIFPLEKARVEGLHAPGVCE